MKQPLLFSLLVVLWVGLTGHHLVELAQGLVVAWLVLRWVPDVPSRARRPSSRRLAHGLRSLWPALRLGGVFLGELVMSTLRVAREALRPRLRVRPAVLHIPLDARSDAELTVFAALLSLTPGLLCVDVAEDGKGIFVHAMHVRTRDLDATRRGIRDGFWPHVARALRQGEVPPREAPGGARPGLA